MGKKVLRLISGLFMLCMLLNGCGKETQSVSSITVDDGILTWNEVADASYYEVDIGNGRKKVSGTGYDLTDAFDTAGEYGVTVYYVTEQGEHKKLGEKKIEASLLEEPVINTIKSGKKYYFVWSDVDRAAGYTYDAHDGNGYCQAKAESDGAYRVEVTDTQKQMITVVAKGGSEGDKVLVSSKATYTYKDDCMFDMALLAKYPTVFTSDGALEETMKVGSTLKKGVYSLKVSVFLMDNNGNRVTGNGTWGRRMADNDTQFYWFCETELSDWKGSGNTIPDPDKKRTMEMNLRVDDGGNIIFNFADFTAGEKVVIADVTYNGKNVISSDGGKERPVEEVKKLNIDSVKNYIAKFVSPGGWYTDQNKEEYEIKIPTKMSDGLQNVKITYYACTASGAMLSGNGMWGRRIAGANLTTGPFEWLNEYDAGSFQGVEIPKPTEKKTGKLAVNVEKGYFTLSCVDFDEGETIIITDVTEGKTKKGNGIFVSDGNLSQTFKVKTTLTGKPRHANATLKITYKVYDAFGETLTGNGSWGRRIDSAGKWYFICEDAVENYPDAKGTIPKATKSVTQEFTFSEINKFGVIKFTMYDFDPGEVMEITSIKYDGKEVLAK